MIRGEGPSPYEVNLLLPGLPDDGMVAAVQQARAHGYSDKEAQRFYGWGTERWLLKHLYDAINMNTLASGNWAKGKQPKFEPFPSPLDEKPESLKKPASDLTRIFSMLTGR